MSGSAPLDFLSGSPFFLLRIQTILKEGKYMCLFLIGRIQTNYKHGLVTW